MLNCTKVHFSLVLRGTKQTARGKPLGHYGVQTVGISGHYLGIGNITKNK